MVLENVDDEPLLRENPDRYTMFPIKCARRCDVSYAFGPD